MSFHTNSQLIEFQCPPTVKSTLRIFQTSKRAHQPTPVTTATATTPPTTMSETDRFDALLMNVAQTQRGIEPLLDTVFSFLRRKTDFFSGASAETIESTVLKCVRKQAQLADEAQQRKRQEDEQKRKKLAAAEQKRKAEQKAAVAAEKTARETPRFEEITDDNSENAPANATEKKPAAAATIVADATAKDAKKEGSGDDDEEEDNGPRTAPL